MTTLSWSVSPAHHLADIAFPMRQSVRDSAPAFLARWCLHVLLWGALLAALWYLNRALGAERWLRSPWPVAHGVWLPMLGLTAYALGWLGCGLMIALRKDLPASPWPELDAAWLEARDGLMQARIDQARAPAFLVLGPLSNDLSVLLESLDAKAVTSPSSAPFQVFARVDSIFVVCAGVSQLGVQTSPSDSDEGRQVSARLRHLCELLMHDRPRQVTLQGVILLAPFDAARSARDTRALVQRCQHDLQAVRAATGLETPIFLAISGLGPLPGHSAADGWYQRFPPVPDLDPAEVLAMFQNGAEWLCSTQIPRQLRAGLRLDTAAGEPGNLTSGLLENISLYQQWAAIQNFRPRLVRLLVEATQNEFSEPGMVAGCYLLPGGEAGEATRVTAKALWQDLSTHRRCVAWTSEALARLGQRRWRVRLGYALGFLAIGSLTVGMTFLLWRPS